MSFLVVSETSEEEFEQGSNSFRGCHREGRYFPRFRGRGPRMGRGGNRWHDGVPQRLLAPYFENSQIFDRPWRFEGPRRFNGHNRFTGARFDGPGSNRFNLTRFDGRPPFDGPPMFMRGGPPVEGPFRGGLAMGPTFRGPILAGGVQPLLSIACPPWNDDGAVENEEGSMENEGFENEDFERTGSGEPAFDQHRLSWTDSPQMEDEEKMHKGSGDISNKPEHVSVKSDSESKTAAENTRSSADSSTAGEKRVRKSRWSNMPPDSAEQCPSAQSGDSNTELANSVITTEPADSTLNPETDKTDTEPTVNECA